MKKSIPNLIKLFGASCIIIVLTVIALVFLSEKFTGAEISSKNSVQPNINPTPNNSSPANTKIYADALERVRNEYANVKSVEMDSTVTIEIIKSNGVVSGTGQISYVAKGNKYKYVCAVSDNLVDEGLMRNVDVLFTGEKYYFYDRESKIVSFQSSEEVRLPSALPNPFFLPLDYLSNDDDSCENCKLRLHDVRMPTRWAKRISSISEILRENTNVIHSIIEMPGGEMNKLAYNYRVRLVGESTDNLQPIAVLRVKPDGTPFAEVILNDLRTVQGINVKIPHSIEIGARDETGSVVLRAVFTITNLKINQPAPDSLLAPNFAGAEQFWDSDEKKLVTQ